MISVSKIINWFRLKSPCHKEPMTSYFDMEHDKLVYECPKCKKEWI